MASADKYINGRREDVAVQAVLIPDDCFTKKNGKRLGWPDNRPPFATMSHGELLFHMEHDDSDVIIWCGADMVFQRELTEQEYKMLSNWKYDWYGHNLCNTQLSMREEFDNLLPKMDEPMFNAYNNMPLIGLASNPVRAKSLKKICEMYENLFEMMVEQVGRHAGNQWLNSYCVYQQLVPVLLPIEFQCAHWYIGLPTSIAPDGKLLVNGKVVLINHTK